jgi:hypothetical protein
MKPKEFYDYITQHLTPEQALMKLLEGSLINYEKLKFDSKQESVHPVLVMSMAAMDAGWVMAIKSNETEVNGMVVGTKEYVDSVFKK